MNIYFYRYRGWGWTYFWKSAENRNYKGPQGDDNSLYHWFLIIVAAVVLIALFSPKEKPYVSAPADNHWRSLPGQNLGR